MSEDSWKSLIGDARREVFVGRGEELEECKNFVDERDHRVLYIQGVGGIGKTTLLREMKAYAERDGWDTRWLDAAVLGDSAPEIEQAFLEATDADDDNPVLLFVDNFEAIAPLEKWIRDSLLPKLPFHAWLAIGGRPELSHSWKLDSGWSQLTRTIRLAPLDDEASRAFLEAKGVEADRRAKIVDMAHGLPIALALAAENALQGEGPTELLSARDVNDLFERLAQEHMTPDQRQALEVAGLAWVVNEEILKVAIDAEDTDELMVWLAQRPYMQLSDEGLQPHPVVRNLIDDQFRRNSPARRQRVRERLQDHYLEILRQNEPVQGAHPGFQLYFMARRERGGGQDDFERSEQVYVDHARQDDEIPSYIETFEGPRSAEIASYWLEKYPNLAFAFRNKKDELRGFVQFVELEKCTAEERELDPIIDLTIAELDELEDLRQGETARMARFWFDANAYQDRNPMQTRMFVLMWNTIARVPGASYGPMAARDPEVWEARKDRFLRKLGEIELDDHLFAVFSRDWREYDALEHIRFRNDVMLTGNTPTEPPAPRYRVLSHEEFEDAVRDALKNYHRGDRLMDNELVYSRMARIRRRDRNAPSTVEPRLRELLEEAIESLGDVGEDRIHKRVLRKTYLASPTKQRAVADALSMSFSTYRRKLTEAIERVVSRLWHRELSGR